MARPTKDPSEKRSETVKLRLTLAEHEFVRAQAQTAELSVSEYLRRRALSLPVTAPPRRADAALVSELNRIGINLQQFLRNLYTGREYRGDWQGLYDQLQQIMAKAARTYDA